MTSIGFVGGICAAVMVGAAAAALLTAAPTAEAQTLKDLLERRDQSREQQPETPAAPETAAAEAEPEKPRLSREEELEIAFENLRSEEEPVWKAAQEKITKSWARSGSPSMDLLLTRGRTAMEKKDLEAAEDHLTDLVNLAPDFAEGWNARATVRFQMEKPGLALADLAEAVAADPRHFGAYAGLGIVFENIDRPREAIAAHREALKIHPNLEGSIKAVARLAKEADGRPI